MKLTLTISDKKLELEITPNAMRVLHRHQIKMAKLQGSAPAPQVQYNNCSIGQPFPISVPMPQVRGNEDDAINYTSNQTGIDKEIIGRAWESIKQYFRDKNEGERS